MEKNSSCYGMAIGKGRLRGLMWIVGLFCYSLLISPLPAGAEICAEIDFNKPTIAASFYHDVGLREDGTVVGTGPNLGGELNVSDWTNIKAIAAGGNDDYPPLSHTVGLKEDGTVVAVGNNWYGQLNVSDWTNIKAIAAGSRLTVGLKENGTVVVVGDTAWWGPTVSSWTNIKAIASNYTQLVGLKEDGTVVAVGLDVSSWTNIKAIAAGLRQIYGLKEDGTVVVGDMGSWGADAAGWTNIKAIAAGDIHTVGIKNDGTVVAIGRYIWWQLNVSNWTNITAIAAGSWHTIGLKEDGTVVADGDYTPWNPGWWPHVSDWTNIRQPACFSYAPVANAGTDQLIECASPSGISVTLNASGSSDSDGDPLTYTWTWDGGSAEGVNPTVTLPSGTTVITLIVSDGKATATDTINITVQDTISPVTTATGSSENWYNADIISTFTATDTCSGVKEIHYTVNSAETVIPGSSASAIITTEGTNNITYYAVDNAGNIESSNSFTVKIDKTSPTGSVIINSDAVTTTSTSVTLTISATDNLSGISQMHFSNDGTSWSSWEPYNISKNWTLSNVSDLMTVYVQLMDVAGNASASYSDTIYMDTDNDGFYDSLDNCPNVNNPLQEDRNGNLIGDACDGDLDGDTIVDIRDNCPATSNPDQLDSDGDSAGDVCDACISDPQNNCLNSSSLISRDITQPVTVTNFADTASVTIEPGDISTDTSITVTGETSYSNFALGSNQQVLGAIYTFTADPPSDINSPFNSPVRITLRYNQGTMPEGGRTEQNLDIFYYDTMNLIWVPQNAGQDMYNNTLTLDIDHFSSYAVIATENPISDLIAAFRGVSIQDGSTWENLMNQLTRAYDEYEGGDNEDVKDDLRTFINKLESGSREKIGQQDTDMLIQFANEIMARL